MTQAEFEIKRVQTSGKWIETPGTYSLLVREIKLQGQNQWDSQWVDLIFTLENTDGQTMTHYVSIPTTAERSFLFGKKKSLNEYNKLDAFLRGFGIKLEYSSAMTQIADLFGDYEINFVGKTVSARVGYVGNRAKYNGKVGENNTYILVDKNEKPIDENVFSDIESAKNYAKDNSIKLSGFMRVLEVVPASVSAIAPLAAVSDLPF